MTARKRARYARDRERLKSDFVCLYGGIQLHVFLGKKTVGMKGYKANMTPPLPHLRIKLRMGTARLQRASKIVISTGVVHTVPPDLRKALTASSKALAVWGDITPLARNEWICWVISGKKAGTREIRIEKALSKLASGMRRPCCWAGCPHR